MRDAFALLCDAEWVWLSGMAGFIRAGISRPGLEASARLLGIKPKKLRAAFPDVRIMEAAAMEYWARTR